MIPVSLVTGFLGSGKTTLISALLRQPGMEGALVIVNEFGEVGIDHDLLEASSDDTILLANGCLCCTIRGNLVDTLLDVQAQVAEGRLRAFDRVVVETSGVADPGPLIAFAFGDPRILAAYQLGRVIVTVDAAAGVAALERHAEAMNQVALADLLLVTKPDLAEPGPLMERLRQLNAAAEIVSAVEGQGIPASALARASRHVPGRCAPGCDDPHHHHHHAHDDHAGRFHADLLLAQRSLHRAELSALTQAMRAALTPAMLRAKGLLPLADGGCAVIQATASTVHEPALMARGVVEQGRLVVIGEGAERPALIAALAPFGLLPAPRLPAPH
jgi:G3E family GTPase